MFRKREKEQVNAGMIDTQGRQMPPRAMPDMMQAAPQYIPPPPTQPVTPIELKTFIEQYRLFGPESFTAPGIYESTVCNLLYGIYAEIHKSNSKP